MIEQGEIGIFIIFTVIAFLVGFIIGMKPSEEKCPKCNSKVNISYEYGKSYEIKKCTSCEWKTKRDMNEEQI